MTLAPRGTMPAIVRGMFLLARGRAEGLNCFGDSPRAIIGSLIPGLGLVIGAMAEGWSEGLGFGAIGEMLAPICGLLAPAVLSHELARWWGREAFWGRYIVAFNWCQWLIPVVAMALITGLALLHLTGLAGANGVKLLIVCLAGYALWLNWFVARHGLALTPGRAIGFVLGVNLGTMLLVFVPALLAGGPR